MKKKVLVLGGLLVDRYLHLLYYPKRGEDTIIHKEKEYIGGCPYNVAIALKSLGAEPIVYSAIGDNHEGLFIEKELSAKKLDTSCIFKLSNSESGYCLIMLDDERERTFFAKHGCEGYFNSEIISDTLLSEINCIYLTGIYLLYEENNIPLLEFLKKAVSLGKKIIFDVAPMVASINESILLELLPLCYVIKVNNSERVALEKIIRRDITKSPLLSNVLCIIETNGSKGSTVYYQNQSIHTPSYTTTVIDSNGAGDNFTAGFIYSIIEEYKILDSMKIASACGSLACETLGTTVSYTMEDVKHKMNQK